MRGTGEEVRVLMALGSATGFTINAHVPKNAVSSRLRRDERGNVGKCLKILARKGLATKHPTGRQMTWNLSRDGLIICECLSKTDHPNACARPLA